MLLTSQPTGRIHSFQLPKKILFGVKSSENVGLEAKALGGKTAFLVTDKNLEKTGVPAKIEGSLVSQGFEVEIFDEVEPEPVLEVAENVASTARRKKYDTIIGVGGGSVLDMAKVAAMASKNPGPMRNYVGVDLVKNPGVPSILLPTTSGTGSEVTNVAVLTIAEDELKTSIISPHLFCNVAIVDPSLTYSLPPRLTASTGMDALSHALEALISVNANSITDSLAFEAIKLIFVNLPKAYKSSDPESREGMSLGSLIAGMSFGNAGVCLGHAAAYTFAVSHKVSHGTSCGLVLPYVFRFCASAIPWKLPRIAEAVGIETESLGIEETGLAISEAILGLMDKLQMPKRLRDLNIPQRDLPKLAEKLLTFSRLIKRTPKPLSQPDAVNLFETMW
ncbi:iron-containing alcohol dehydrogenase [Candidatus Bathyarchaeota archaeon]|nr:iron-containing alcohol dehydrogenase [Candidatus Bathyarchaeota archaeon]